MTKHILRFWVLGLLLFGTQMLAWASGDPVKAKEPGPNTLVLPSGMSAARAKQLQLSMQKALSGLDASFANMTFEDVVQPLVEDDTQAARDSAARVFDKVKYIKELNVLNQELPIGIKESRGNTTVEVAISKILLRPGYAEVTIYYIFR